MHARDACRVVVTGIGLCTPLGSDRESSWRNLVVGRSGVRWLAPPHWTESSPIAGAPVCLPTERPFRHREPLVELALTTATEALTDARWTAGELARHTVGVVYGTSKGGLHTFSRLFEQFRAREGQTAGADPKDSDPTDWLDVFPDRAATSIGQLIGGYGPILCPVAACATGLAACLRGAQLIQSGDCDIVLAGSTDVSLQPALLGSFRRLGVMSREAADPTLACRPYDRQRSGFVIGEGAACLVMERFESAVARGATCYAEWLGGLMLSDTYGLTQLDPEGTTLKRLLQDLRSRSGRRPDYINLHGTGTSSNDLVECQAVREVFGIEADQFDCSSLKGGMGHLLGAAGSVELAATALAIRDQVVPPTVNLADVDPGCDLHLTPRTAKSRRIDSAWKISMGFGGHVAGACLGKLEHGSQRTSNR